MRFRARYLLRESCFTCSARAAQQLIIIVVVVGTKLNYQQYCGILVLVGVLIVVVFLLLG